MKKFYNLGPWTSKRSVTRSSQVVSITLPIIQIRLPSHVSDRLVSKNESPETESHKVMLHPWHQVENKVSNGHIIGIKEVM